MSIAPCNDRTGGVAAAWARREMRAKYAVVQVITGAYYKRQRTRSRHTAGCAAFRGGRTPNSLGSRHRRVCGSPLRPVGVSFAVGRGPRALLGKATAIGVALLPWRPVNGCDDVEAR